MAPAVRRLSRDFQALRAVVRLRILAALAAGESNVADLGAALRISQPLLSWHLKELRLAGFVESQRVGARGAVSAGAGALSGAVGRFGGVGGIFDR